MEIAHACQGSRDIAARLTGNLPLSGLRAKLTNPSARMIILPGKILNQKITAVGCGAHYHRTVPAFPLQFHRFEKIQIRQVLR